MDQMENGFWSALPTGLQMRAIGWAAYYSAAAGAFLWNPIYGALLLVLPSLLFVLKNWISGQDQTGPLTAHITTHIWGRWHVVARLGLGIAIIASVTIALGWVATADMRLEAAEPTLAEKVGGAASASVEATKETASGWWDTAKGWFSREEELHSP
ncbi:MAG: hypothetical protein QNJ20_04475 [Paracoccaceae bacterium]|nr:hypothetical protein [Paracoccaceae bacterium]